MQQVKPGDIRTLGDRLNWYAGRQVEVISINTQFGAPVVWVKLVSDKPGTIEFAVKQENLQ